MPTGPRQCLRYRSRPRSATARRRRSGRPHVRQAVRSPARPAWSTALRPAARYSSLHIRHVAPSSSTTTAIAESGFAAAATSATCSTVPTSSSERSTRITHPISPRSTVTRTRDFSGTKPSTAGSAAIRTPGRFRWKSGDCDVVMVRPWRNATVADGAPTPMPAPAVDERATGDRGGQVQCKRLQLPNRRLIHTILTPVGVQDVANRRRPCAMGSMLEYDLVVIGSGPGGQKAAIAAAKLGKIGGGHRTRPDAGRCLREHRNHPVQDAA